MLNDPIVVVVERRSAAERLAPQLSARWPGRTIFVAATNVLGLYEFRYPRGLSMKDFPYIHDPVWRPRDVNPTALWKVQDDALVHCNVLFATALQSASSIVFACDPDPRGAFAFHILLQQILGESAAVACWPALFLMDYRVESIAKGLAEHGTTLDSWFVSARNAGLARRFFDYNFNVNAMALVSQRPDQLVSKYSLQLLYALRDFRSSEKSRHSLNEGGLLVLMQHWIGTGKYPPCMLGSPISQAEIIRGLQSQGLLDGAALTSAGLAFLDRLHPDCRDLDLPARINQWEQSWPESRPSMERYLRTFFGKQRRHRSPRLS